MSTPQRLPDVLTASEARTNLYEMLAQAKKYLRRFTITHRGKPQVVVMPAEEIDSLEETMEILSDKQLVRQLKQAEKDYKSGKFYTLAEVETSLKKRPRPKKR